MPLRLEDALRKVKLSFLHSAAQLGTPLSQVKAGSHQYEGTGETPSIHTILDPRKSNYKQTAWVEPHSLLPAEERAR